MQTIMIVEDDPDIRDGVRIALDCNRVWVDEQEADLTETEYKILKLLMQSRRTAISKLFCQSDTIAVSKLFLQHPCPLRHLR